MSTFLDCYNELKKYSINVLGQAFDVTKKYQYEEKCASSKRIYHDMETPWDYDIVIASSGMLLEESESFRLMEGLLKENVRDVALIQTGFIPPFQEGSRLIQQWKTKGNLYLDISLSAHASNSEIHKLIDSFEIGHIISIHGDGIE